MAEVNPYNKAEFLNTLRAKTAASHKRLEDIGLSTRIVRPDVTLDEYKQYLQLMHPVHADAEQYIYPLLKNLVTDVDARKKAHYITNDLVQVGHTSPVAPKLPFTEKMPQMSEAFALGVMYVIEGSTLGGRVILKNIQPALQLSEDNGATYFAGYRADTGPAWQRFLQVLTSYPNSEADEQEIIAGADFAFSAIYDHMQ